MGENSHNFNACGIPPIGSGYFPSKQLTLQSVRPGARGTSLPRGEINIDLKLGSSQFYVHLHFALLQLNKYHFSFFGNGRCLCIFRESVNGGAIRTFDRHQARSRRVL